MTKSGSRILKSARQALAYAKGTAKTHQYGVHPGHRKPFLSSSTESRKRYDEHSLYNDFLASEPKR